MVSSSICKKTRKVRNSSMKHGNRFSWKKLEDNDVGMSRDILIEKQQVAKHAL